jgi:hypothetical protein
MCINQITDDTVVTPFPKGDITILRLQVGDVIILAPGFGNPPSTTTRELTVVDPHIFTTHCHDRNGNDVYLTYPNYAGITHINGQPVATKN